MIIRYISHIIVIILFFSLTSCFGGIEKKGSVVGYGHGVVKTEGGSFRIGDLPEYWKRQKIDYRAVLFVNQKDYSTITIDSWCRRAADDSSLKSLTKDLLHGLQDVKKETTYDMTTVGRAALLTESTGTMDGQDVFISTYVFKMNTCVFDFVFVSYPDELNYYEDFKTMIDGFKFIKGPKIL